jgi:hypothetical protein
MQKLAGKSYRCIAKVRRSEVPSRQEVKALSGVLYDF